LIAGIVDPLPGGSPISLKKHPLSISRSIPAPFPSKDGPLVPGAPITHTHAVQQMSSVFQQQMSGIRTSLSSAVSLAPTAPLPAASRIRICEGCGKTKMAAAIFEKQNGLCAQCLAL
jgi:hypothetical protein